MSSHSSPWGTSLEKPNEKEINSLQVAIIAIGFVQNHDSIEWLSCIALAKLYLWRAIYHQKSS